MTTGAQAFLSTSTIAGASATSVAKFYNQTENVSGDYAQFVNLLTGGQISSGSSGSNTGGDINIYTALLNLTGMTGAISSAQTQISAGTTGAGNGGSITITSNTLSLNKSSSISAGTSAAGDGGSITITDPGTISILNQSVIDVSSTASTIKDPITMAITNGGSPGTIDIGYLPNPIPGQFLPIRGVQVAELDLLNGSTIESNNTSGLTSATNDEGHINIFANVVNIQHNSSVTATNENSAVTDSSSFGINITAGSLFYLNDYSEINTRSAGDGGNIAIDPEFEVLNHSTINAFGQKGDGNINIDSNFLLSGDSSITATGTVTIESILLDLSGSLVSLPQDLADESKRLRESCARAVKHEFSSLIVVGRGGTETAPDEMRADASLDALDKHMTLPGTGKK